MVIEKANDKYKDDKAAKKQLKRLALRLQELLKAAGDSAGVDKLKSLGYLGGGEDDEEDESPSDN